MAEADPFFAGISQSPHETSSGPCELPILYRDATMLGLFYRLPIERVSPFFEGMTIEAMPVLGRAIVLLIIFEYRETSIGPYGEIGLAIQAQRRGSRPSLFKWMTRMGAVEEAGLYVVNLAVTTEGARAAGCEIWDYPKYVAGITTGFREGSGRVVLENEFELTHRSGFGLRLKGLPFVTFTALEDRLIRTHIPVGHRVKYGGASSVELKLLGDGPTTTTIRALGLADVKPSYAFRTDAMKSILPAGVDVGAARGEAPG